MRVLLVEDNPGDARLLFEAFREADAHDIEFSSVARLSEAVKQMQKDRFDAIFLDLSLPDSWGLNTLVTAHDCCPEVPIIVLTGSEDHTLGVKAVQAGAQDYLVKGQLDGEMLVRTMQYAIVRSRQQLEVRAMSLMDELTGVYNRRGFLTLGQRLLRTADRSGTGAAMIFIDLDEMKYINDTHGHAHGDIALTEVAAILQATFRETDVLGRVGGDEFAVVASDIREADIPTLERRLREHLEDLNKKEKYPYLLALSVGATYYNPDYSCDIEELMDRADNLMYEQKRKNKEGRLPLRTTADMSRSA